MRLIVNNYNDNKLSEIEITLPGWLKFSEIINN